MSASTSDSADGRDAGSKRPGLHILMLDPAFQLPDRMQPARSFDLAVRLERAGHRINVITLKTQNAPAIGSARIVVDGAQTGDKTRAGYPLPARWLRRFPGGVAWRIWRQQDVDAVVAADCPSAALLTATAFCLFRGMPLLLDVRRGPAEVPATASFGVKFAAFLRRLVFRIAAKRARRIFALTHNIRDHLLQAGAAAGKIIFNPLGCDDDLAKPGTAFQFPAHLANGRIVLYAGPMEAKVRLDRVIALAAVLRDTGMEPIHFVFCGDGPARKHFTALAADQGVLEKNVWFLESFPRRHLAGALALAGAVLVNAGAPNAESSAGFYDALAAHRPLVILDDGLHRELIEARGAGIGLPEDPGAAAREVADFLGDPDGLRRARSQAAALAAGRFNLERTAAEFRIAVESAVAEAPRAMVLRNRLLRIKRIIDVTVSAVALVVLSPVFVILTILVGIKMGWPPIFAQARPGLKGELFRIYKFRTMTNAKDASGALLPDETRLTPLGKFLRRTSLDELPELVNVLKGDMSLVGPRPLLPEYLPHYTAEQRQRHDLRPGMTGWSQVNGRNALSWEEKFKFDVWYVENISLWLDFKILLKTIWIAVSGRGITASGHATMPRFDEIMARREGAEDI